MKLTESYKDLIREIEGLEIRKADIEGEAKQLRKLMLRGPKDITGIDYSKQPGGQTISIPLDKIIDRLNRIESTLEVLEDTLKLKKETRGQIEGVLGELEGLEHKVAYKRDIEGKDLRTVAEELGYEYGYIKNISMRINRKKVE